MKKTMSVIAGFAAWTVLYLGSNALLVQAFPAQFDSDGVTTHQGMLGLVVALSLVWSIVAGVVQASIAKDSGMKLAWVLGLLLLLVGVVVEVAYWNTLPVWYHFAFLMTLVPGTLMGATLHRVRAS